MTESFQYYELQADPNAIKRWYLGAPSDKAGREIDPRLFTQGVPVEAQPLLTLPLRRTGSKVDFNFCDFDMIVTPRELNLELEALVGAAIQRIPVLIENGTVDFEILNVCDLVDCIDESQSLATKWAEADGRPEKIGRFRMVAMLKINPDAARGHHIFRVAGWPITTIVSEEVKRLFEAKMVTGLKYERVDC